MTLIERLLAHREEHLVTSGDHVYDEVPLCVEAAARIAELEAALTEIASHSSPDENQRKFGPIFSIARAALAKEPK